MSTAADAAREFATGPRVLEAARILLNSFSLVQLCEALVNVGNMDAEHLVTTLGRLAEFEELHPAFLADDVVAFLAQAPEAPDPRVRAIVGKLLRRLAEGAEENTTRLAATGLLDRCEPLVLVEETGSSEIACKALLAAARWKAGCSHMLAAGGVVERLQGRLKALPEIQRIRVLHFFVELGKVSDEVFFVLEARGAYRAVLGAFLTDDILLKMNAVELMDTLGGYPAGQALLAKQGIPDQLALDLVDPSCDDSVLLCVVRLLGLVVRNEPGTLASLLPGREAPLAQTIAGLLDSREHAKRLCALNAWANISTTQGGLAFFLQWEGRLETILGHVVAAQNETCKGAMAAWAVVLQDRPPPVSSQGGGSATGTEEAPELQLWSVAEQRLLPLVLRNLKGKPFADVRFHVWHLLALLCQSRTAAQKIVPSEEMRDLFLDFQSEQNTDARIAKHAFVKVLQQRHADWLGAFLDENVVDLLAEWSRQGPHWVPRKVATLVGDQAA